jgi:hypothetical protein
MVLRRRTYLHGENAEKIINKKKLFIGANWCESESSPKVKVNQKMGCQI